MQTRQRCSRPSSCQHVSRESTKDSGSGRVDVRDVQEPVLVLVLLVDGAHQRSSWGKDLVDEDEDGLLRAELDALANHVDELAHGEICWNEILLLVDSSDVRLLDLLADDLYSGLSVLLLLLLLLLLATLRGRVCVCVARLTGILSAYFWRMRSASAFRFSNGCSSLNLERIVAGGGVVCFAEEAVCRWRREGWFCWQCCRRCCGCCCLVGWSRCEKVVRWDGKATVRSVQGQVHKLGGPTSRVTCTQSPVVYYEFIGRT